MEPEVSLTTPIPGSLAGNYSGFEGDGGTIGGTVFANYSAGLGQFIVNYTAFTPEPGTLVLLALGMAGLRFARLRRTDVPTVDHGGRSPRE